MSEPVNLNKARKARDRAQAKTEAGANRLRFGRTKAERQAAATEQARASRDLEGHRRAPDD